MFLFKKTHIDDFKNKPIENDEPLGRFILCKDWIRSSNQTVKHNAFMPAFDLNLSVFRIKGLDEESVWTLAQVSVISKMKESRTLYGRAEIIPLNVYSNKLEIDPNNNPNRHANITKWPKEKHEQKIIATELASKASLKLR